MNLGTRLAQAVVDHDRSLAPDKGQDDEVIVPSKIWRQFLDLAKAELQRRRRAQHVNRINQNREHAP